MNPRISSVVENASESPLQSQDALEECDVLIHAVPVQSSRKAGAKHLELDEVNAWLRKLFRKTTWGFPARKMGVSQPHSG